VTSKSAITQIVTSAYGARERGDLDGLMSAFAEDAVFELNGRGTGVSAFSAPIRGKAAIKTALGELMHSFRFSDWRIVKLIVEGEHALLHWSGEVTFAPNGKSASFDVFDVYTFRDGKITSLHQSTDTAMVASLAAV